MITTIIILSILLVFVIGFYQVYNRKIVKKIDFAGEYRNKFIDFANKYFKTHDRWNRSGDLDEELYVWLTMNISKIQNHVGSFGIMSYNLSECDPKLVTISGTGKTVQITTQTK